MGAAVDNPPGLFKPDTAALDQLAFEITAAVDAAHQLAGKGTERFREAGLLLIKAKAALPSGQWLIWVAKNIKRSPREVQRWMRLAKYDKNVVFDESWKIISGHYDATDDPQRVTEERKLCRDCRVRGPKPNCPKCAELNQKEEEEREAGDEPKDLGDKVLKAIETGKTRFGKLIDMLAKVRTSGPQDAAKARQAVQASLGLVKKLYEAPVRPPEPAKCRSCGEAVQWVTTSNHKRMLLSADRDIGGRFEIIDGLATVIEYDGTGTQRLYRNHFLVCKRSKP